MKIAVFCGSGMGNDPVWAESARVLGTWIGQKGYDLVYGGGEAGLMGVVAGAAFENGSHVTGVLPGNVDFIKNRPQPWCSEVILTEDMSARKQKMMELADEFIALPGGVGTLDEIADTITLTRIGVFHKDSTFINTNGFYEPLRQMLQQMVEAGFLEKEVFEYVHFRDAGFYSADTRK